MSKLFNFKATVWETVIVPEHLEDKIANLISNGIIQSREELEKYLKSVGETAEVYFESSFDDSPLPPSFTQMSVAQNSGDPTIEVLHDNKIIWDNTLPLTTDNYRICILTKTIKGLSEESIYGTEEQALESAYKDVMNPVYFRAPNSNDTLSNYIDEYYEYVSTTLDNLTDYNISVRYLNINL
jgi:hypothetical protein